ncbi:MAG: glycosyltransferase [Betaproteobacteria bacterium]|nr:glycosyltransferase [Betaproteobacteria bacterium]
MPPIDVIIPVFRGYSQTRSCIESVLAAPCASSRHVVVVDDASPEPAISSWLDQLASEGRIELLRNPANAGFVASVNRAMSMHPGRDAVLLNSDTEVSAGWLDRIVACATRHPDAASVCPLSNNATLASYPRIGESNPLPPGVSVAELAGVMAEANAGRDVAIPTSVGFCMWIARSAWEEIGGFDAASFGRGYGEENDWCLRASAAGYAHYLAADAFVFHEGEVSFGADAIAGRRHAQSVISQRDPAYAARIAKFFQDDPLRVLRRRADLLRLTASKLPKLLFVSHQWGGGTEQHLLDMAQLLDGRAQVLVMKPRGAHAVEIRWVTGHRNREEFCVYFNWISDGPAIADFLRSLAVARVHVHHIHGHAQEVLDLAAHLGVPLDITLHDYFPLTPQYHLDPGGALPAGVANAWGWSDSEWRSRMGTFLAGASRVIAPSQDLAGRVRAHLPGVPIEVWPHPSLGAPPVARPAKVLVLGGLTNDKGLQVLLACARDAKQRRLPLHFEILGHTQDPVPTFPDLPVTLLGSYPQDAVDLLVSLTRADVALFPAQIPESFSFTLGTALRAGLPIVASRLGAFPERLANWPGVELVEWDALPETWNAALTRLSGERPPLPGEMSAEVAAAYIARYLAPVAAKTRDCDCTDVAEHRYFAPRELPKDAELTLEHLYRGGVLCGHRPARSELEARIAKFDNQLRMARESADAAHEVARQTGERETANAERFRTAYEEQERNARAWREEYEKVIRSRSWRLTAPLRKAVRLVQYAAGLVGHWRRGLRVLPLQMAVAYRILRTQGPHALWMRLRQKFARSREQAALPAQSFKVEDTLLPLALPQSDAPRWSILVPVHGQHALTYTCLKSLAETCAGQAVEIIVADDASPEPVTAALAMVTGMRVLRNPSNLGFLRTCNAAAQHARGEYLVLLNNDTIVLGDWLQQLSAVFEQDPAAGLAGAKLLFPDGKLQEAGGIVWRDGSASNYGRGFDPRRPEFNYRREADYCSGACIMLPMDLWRALGGFDERYLPAYYEDTDLAFRVREAGRKVIYQPHAEVVHFEGQSSGTDITQGVKRHQAVNQSVFETRWRKVLQVHRAHGVAPQRERDRTAKRRVLVFDVCIPRPDRDSGSLRMFEMLRAMRALGCRIAFVADNGYLPANYVRDLQSLGVEVLHAPYIDPLSEAIERNAHEFDTVILSRAAVAAKYVDLVRARMPEAKLVYDTVDLHFLRMTREAALDGGGIEQAAAKGMKAVELSIIAKADLTLVVSDFERALLETEAPRAHVQVLSNIHDPEPGEAAFSQRSGAVFIGGFLHPPNVDAVQWYAEQVLPILRRRAPGFTTTIIGGDVPESLKRLGAADLVFAGFVPDVKPLFNAARVAISPLRYGAGVKGKVNLAMQYGVPVVATPCSVEGMHLAHGRDVWIAQDAEAFAEAILSLCNDEGTWQRLRDGGVANIRRHFSRDHAKTVLKDILDL